MLTLPELQRRFLGGVLDGDAESAAALLRAGTPAAAERIGIYANNAAGNFQDSLALAFPVVRRLVGADYFVQCVTQYHRAQPSRSGDLHHTGAGFPDFMAALHADGPYGYLGDVARLEWLYEDCLIAADHGPLDLARLAAVPATAYEGLHFVLHPAVRLFESDYPALAIWQANRDATAEPGFIDLQRGGERVLLTRTGGRIEFTALAAGDAAFFRELFAGANLQGALAAAATDPGCDAAAVLRRGVERCIIVDFQLTPSE